MRDRAPRRDILADILMLAAAALVVAGVAMLWIPASFIAAGLILAAGAVWIGRGTQ